MKSIIIYNNNIQKIIRNPDDQLYIQATHDYTIFVNGRPLAASESSYLEINTVCTIQLCLGKYFIFGIAESFYPEDEYIIQRPIPYNVPNNDDEIRAKILEADKCIKSGKISVKLLLC